MKTTARAALLFLSLAAAACTRPNRESVFVDDVCAFPDDAKTCSFQATCSKVLIGYPWVYTQVGAEAGLLELPIQFNNQLPDNTDAEAGRTNTNIAVVDTVKLSFDAPNLGLGIPDISIPISTTIPTEGATVELVHVLPQEIAQYLLSNWPATAAGSVYVTVHMKLKGHYLSDSPFETGDFPVAIQVINGVFPGYACPAGQVVTAVCPNYGQSAAVSCEAPTT